MKTLIKNGSVITSENTSISDILIHDGMIIRVGSHISEEQAIRTIDASGKYIFPGGVDPHVHMHLPGVAGYSTDDFASGSRAALFGGTTTLLDFVTPTRGEPLTRALDRRKAEAINALTDFSFHVSPVEWRSQTGSEIKECISKGVTSFKIYMAYKESVGIDDAALLNVLSSVAEAGGLVTAHCEMGDKIEELRNSYFEKNHHEPSYHALSRPPELEAAAVARAIELASATGCALYIVHVSAAESLKHIREARARGQRVYAETCPQYLLLDESKYLGDFKNTAPYVISPPLRTSKDNEALWEALADGTISTAGTDHCPYNMSQKEAGINDFRKIPGGAGGVEHRLALLYTYGVLEGRITLNRLADIFSTQPARIFGLYPLKGEILEGSDADLVIWNPDSQSTISSKTHHQNCDINIFEGFKVKGNADYVISNGNVIIDGGVMTGTTSSGRFLSRNIH